MAARVTGRQMGYRTWLVVKGRLSRAAASANWAGVSLRSRAVERTSLAGMSPPPQARRMSSRACLTVTMSLFFVARSDAFMICLVCFGGCAGWEVLPSWFTVVAATGAFVLELAA